MRLPGPRGWQPDAFVAHMRDVVGELQQRDDRRLLLRAPLDVPNAWTGADGDVTPRVAWTSPHGSPAEALGLARQCPLTRLRWQQDKPHPDDLAQLQAWLARHPFLTDALLACGFPQLQGAEISVPVWLWLPRLWLHALPDRSTELSVVLLGDDEPEAVYAEVTRLLRAVQPGRKCADAPQVDDPPDASHFATIARLIARLRAGEAQKVVWSRALPLAGTWPRSVLAQRMRTARPEAWTVDVQLPGGENFLCATPELLVACHGAHVRTMALAGTGSRAQLAAEDRRLSDEHGRVRDFVHDRLQALGVTALALASDIHQAGPLAHRRTEVSGQRPPGVDALTAALTLHPTPALLGLPRQDALALLDATETPRGLYGGCLGRLACDGSGSGEVVALLRGVSERAPGSDSWQVRAGAGLVPDSVAADESAEISQKIAAILASLAPVAP